MPCQTISTFIKIKLRFPTTDIHQNKIQSCLPMLDLIWHFLGGLGATREEFLVPWALVPRKSVNGVMIL